FESRASERLACQRVLDDTHVHAGGARLRAKIRHLRHRESTVLRSDHRKRGFRDLGHFGYQHFLVFEVKGHYPPSWTTGTFTFQNHSPRGESPGTNRQRPSSSAETLAERYTICAGRRD